MKVLFRILILSALNSTVYAAWPDAPWINGAPKPDAVVSGVAFVSPLELQFSRITTVWKRLEKRYSAYNVTFLIVAMKEPELPFNDSDVQEAVKVENYTLPIFLDYNSSYSKLWRAYVSPTVNLVLRSGKVTAFDPGNFDPALFEKTLQRLLKENGVSNLPTREFLNDNETKNCGRPKNFFTGSRYAHAWGMNTPQLKGGWHTDDFGIVSTGAEETHLSLPVDRSQVGLIAESMNGSRLNVTLGGEKIATELRGRDVQEDKSGTTYINVKGPQLYEVVKHATKMKEGVQKVDFSTDVKGLKVWLVETAPACQEL